MKKYELLMFDLDGTIADTSQGVINCVKYAEVTMKLERLREEEYRCFIGPPNRESYSKYYALSGDTLETAIEHHKTYAIQQGFMEAEVYQGIKSLLEEIQQSGGMCAVVTLKLQESAHKFLEYHGLLHYFDFVVGATECNHDKSKLIDLCISRAGVDKEKALMIGDSIYDQIGARDSGVNFIGVTYGFGFKKRKDVEEGPHIAVCESVKELKKMMIGE